MKLSIFTLEVEHEDGESAIDAVLESIDMRISCGDWKDFISTERIGE